MDLSPLPLTLPAPAAMLQAFAGPRAEPESVPVHGQVSPFVRSLLTESAKWLADSIGLLMQVFSPGGFLPAYGERFGLPDLAREFRELDLKNRVAPIQQILSEEEFGRFKDEVNVALVQWIDWWERALAEGVRAARGPKAGLNGRILTLA